MNLRKPNDKINSSANDQNVIRTYDTDNIIKNFNAVTRQPANQSPAKPANQSIDNFKVPAKPANQSKGNYIVEGTTVDPNTGDAVSLIRFGAPSEETKVQLPSFAELLGEISFAKFLRESRDRQQNNNNNQQQNNNAVIKTYEVPVIQKSPGKK